MNISRLDHTQAARLARLAAANQTTAGKEPASAAGAPPHAPPKNADSVEISSTAARLSQLSQIDDIRMDVVDSVRQGIAEGTYETDEKVDAAIEAIIRDLV